MKRINTKILMSMLSLLLVSACNNDDAISFDTSKVGQVEDFVDKRDGHVYRCVQIGDQIWMMDNLAYHLDKGSYEGCFTWDELIFDFNKITIPITNQQFIKVYGDLLDSPNHDWSVEQPDMDINKMRGYLTKLENGAAGYTQSLVLSVTRRYTVFFNLLNEKISEEKEKLKPQFIKEAAKAHLRDAEAANGEYSKAYGLLYSLDAARKAVPEGWRIPSDKDWMKLETTLGMPASELEKTDAWRGDGCGDFIKVGGSALFEAKMGGCNAWSSSGHQYILQGECGYFWTDEEWTTIHVGNNTDSDDNEGSSQENVRQGIIRQVALYSPMIWRGTTRLDGNGRPVCYSVRCVKDAR
ncbi:FISUMP domain-containing protein [Bacteroides acidifaciens]|uniref:FISUMP domain-containing protein n=1 Tax=Bacteroides acidifaciens TaxID=85831 RepID=UPI00301487B6